MTNRSENNPETISQSETLIQPEEYSITVSKLEMANQPEMTKQFAIKKL